MKCEHCGKNEVTFVYQSNINGHVTEQHLCSECAEKLGYAQKLTLHSQRLMDSFFDPFGGFLSRRPAMMDGFRQMLGDFFDNPMDDLFIDMPALGTPKDAQEPRQPLVEDAEQSRFARTRRLNALRHEMKAAVRREDFERAAELRDQIRALESEGQTEERG